MSMRTTGLASVLVLAARSPSGRSRDPRTRGLPEGMRGDRDRSGARLRNDLPGRRAPLGLATMPGQLIQAFQVTLTPVDARVEEQASVGG